MIVDVNDEPLPGLQLKALSVEAGIDWNSIIRPFHNCRKWKASTIAPPPHRVAPP